MKNFSPKFAQRLWAGLFLLCAALSLMTGFITLTYWNDLWYAGSFYTSTSYTQVVSEYTGMVRELTRLTVQAELTEDQEYLDRWRSQVIAEALDPSRTNFRYTVHTQAGELVFSNLPEGDSLLSADVQGVATCSYTIAVQQPTEAQADAQFNLEPSSDPSAQSFAITIDPPVTAAIQGNAITLIMEYGVLSPLVYQDSFSNAQYNYELLHKTWLPAVAAVAVVSTVLAAGLLPPVWKLTRRRVREDSRRWLDRVPLDVYLAAVIAAGVLAVLPAEDIIGRFYQDPFQPMTLIGFFLICLFYALLGLSVYSTVAVRWGRELWQGTFLYRSFAALFRFLKELFLTWPVTRKPVLIFTLYLVLSTGCFLFRHQLGGFTVPLWAALQVVVLVALCRWNQQWRQVQEGAKRILAGEENAAIDTEGFFLDLKNHAQALNNLGGTVRQAVARETQSQRFQAELITNVSHDLKSPLTSIINYVDLLKKADIQDPTAQGYLDVLDRKSHRLKKLTEDLVEASKASTGVLPVNLEPLGLGQLVEQALAEYLDKLEEQNLQVVVNQPPQEVTVLADGKHLWRVLDNLLGNCVKYSLPGTRVYLGITETETYGQVVVKNVSAQPLNLPPEELLGRFVRGDAARTTEGSGLGLSIAQNLTQLQGGTFRLDIDGDLFKAIITLPHPTQEAAP